MTICRYLTGSPLNICSQILSPPIGTQLGIRVLYAGINRLDLLQRAGQYPIPHNASTILGVEISGIVETLGNETIKKKFSVGDRVMALLSGGGYADRVFVEEELCLQIPDAISFEQGAAIPENWITAFQLCRAANVTSHDTVLIHAGASGVGTALIQIIKTIGCKHIITLCGTNKKMVYTHELGATTVLLRHEKESILLQSIMDVTENKGVDVLFDCVGGTAFNLNMRVAALDARWILFGTLGGTIVPSVHLGRFLSKRIQLIGTTLRSRDFDYRAQLIKEFASTILPLFETNEFKLAVKTFPWTDAEKALSEMNENLNIGKLVLKII